MPAKLAQPNLYEDSLEEWGIPRIVLVEDSATGDAWYPLRPIVEVLATDWGTTSGLARTDSRTAPGVQDIRVPTPGGPQLSVYIRRRELAILLTIIDPSRLGPRAKARGKLQEFQNALWHLAERMAFKHRQVADVCAVHASTTATLEGTETGMVTCPVCASLLDVEVSRGKVHLTEH